MPHTSLGPCPRVPLCSELCMLLLHAHCNPATLDWTVDCEPGYQLSIMSGSPITRDMQLLPCFCIYLLRIPLSTSAASYALKSLAIKHNNFVLRKQHQTLDAPDLNRTTTSSGLRRRCDSCNIKTDSNG